MSSGTGTETPTLEELAGSSRGATDPVGSLSGLAAAAAAAAGATCLIFYAEGGERSFTHTTWYYVRYS